MAVISTCVYDAQGRLVRPSQLDISRAKIRLDLDTGGFPTLERGSTHVYVVTDSGLTPSQARQRVQARLRRFFDTVEGVAGYRKLDVKKTMGTHPRSGNTTISYEILYVIEHGRSARSLRPESPHVGSQRGRGAPVYG